jgi:hypothetical protein
MSRLYIEVVGYQPRNSILEDYPDFPVGQTFSLEEVDLMLGMGNLPPGLLLRGRDGELTSPVCIVKGDYQTEQEVIKL